MTLKGLFHIFQVVKGVAVELVFRAYKLVLSPIFYFFGARCRFEPSCSEYARESMQVHGLLFGALLGLKRLLRCHPFGGEGLDPVPKELKLKNIFPRLLKFGSSQH